MAKKTVTVSDLTGKVLNNGNTHARITIITSDAVFVGDAHVSEIKDLTSKLTKQGKRGRKPKLQAA